jgi:hypothetical protein
MGGAVVAKADQADVTEVLRLQGVLRERHAELDGRLAAVVTVVVAAALVVVVTTHVLPGLALLLLIFLLGGALLGWLTNLGDGEEGQ